MICGEYAGTTCTVGGSGRLGEGGSSGMPTALSSSSRGGGILLERAEQLGVQAGDAEDARARVGADHRPDLRDQLRVAAEDRAPALRQALGLRERLHVLDGEGVAAVLAPL